MRKLLVTYIPASMLLAIIAMVLCTFAGCGGDGGGSISGTTPAPAPTPTKSVVITGTVPGTEAIAYDFATGMEVARNVASGTPKTFTLNVAPGTYYLMFLENEGTPDQGSYPFYNVTGGNVFTFGANTTLDLGILVFNGYPRTATPQIDPISGNENVTETLVHEASFSPGDGKWTATRTFVNSTCPGHSPGTTVTENVTIAHGWGLVTYTPAGTNETAIGFANVNTAILTASNGALETIYLTMQPDGSLAGSFSRVGYSGGCSEEGTITAVLGTSPPPIPTLTGLSISGPSSMNETGTATYTATASWSNGSTTSVTPVWSVNPHVAEITGAGVLSCSGGVAGDQTVTITATYSSGGITKTATMNVTIANITTIFPFTDRMLSGGIYFEEHNNAEGDYVSTLTIFHADSSFEQYRYKNPPDMSEYVTGTWSINVSGELILNYGGGETITVVPITPPDIGLSLQVLVDDGTGTSYNVKWERSGPGPYPFRAVLNGTYVDQYGDTWIFNSNGTGSTTGDGGRTFTWSVGDGILKVVFSNGFVGWMYERSTSMYSYYPTTIIRCAFVEYTPAGDFHFYYGGMELTPQ